MKKTLSIIMIMTMLLGMMTSIVSFGEDTNVAKIGDTEYATLAEAVAAANSDTETEGAVVIELISDTTFGVAMTISGNVTIDGNGYTITRANGYTGTLFTVAKNATLTLDDVVVDGGNEWTFNLDEYMKALNSAENIPDNATTAHNRFVSLEAGAPVATTAVFAVSGNMVLESGTVIQNHAIANGDGKYVISIVSGATVTMNDPVLKHNTKVGSHTLFNVSAGGACVVNDAEITDNFGFGNGSFASTSGNLYINDINFHANYGTSNGMFRVYSATAYMEVNGGEFCGNYMVADKNNNWNGMVYVHDSAGTFVMNGGKFNNNTTTMCGGLTAKALGKGTIIVNGGEIKGNVITTTSFGLGNDLCLGAPITINTLDTDLVRLFHNFTNNGTMNVNTIYLHGWLDSYTNGITYSGNGVVNGNIYIFRHARAIMASGSWLGGMVIVDAADINDNKSSLTVMAGATIKGIQIRVLNSVVSGDYLNATESATSQSAAYKQEEGANVTSPVLYYHRLTSAQKSNIVVTFDYNGGLDAQNWSGCQLTSAEAFAPLSPAPMMEGYALIGWKYAVDNDPESLSMEGTSWYAGEEITENVRLVAQWGKIACDVVIEGTKYLDENLAEGFEFEIKKDGETIETVKSDENGKFTFTELVFDEEGTYVFEVSEVIGTDEDVEYDKTTYTVTITVECGVDGKFTATVEGAEEIVFNNKSIVEIPEENPPLTGDGTGFFALLAIVALSLGFVVIGKKRLA